MTEISDITEKLAARVETRIAVASQPTKSATVIKLLSRNKGATAVEIMAATGWQSHSTRAFLSGLRKKGRTIVREERQTGEQTYRIPVGDTVAAMIDVAGS